MRIVFEKRNSKRVLGIVLAVLSPICCWRTGGSAKASLVLMAAALAVAFLRFEIESHSALNGIYSALFFLYPCATFCIGLVMQNISTSDTDLERIILNIGIYLVIQLAVLIIFSNLRLSLIVGCLVPLCLILANTYVYSFRGNALTPSDFLSVRTAASVAAEYDFSPTAPMVYAILLTAILTMSLFCLPYKIVERNVPHTLMEIGLTALCVVGIILGCSKQEVYNWENNGAIYNGYILNFVLQLKDIFVTEPDNYSREAVNTLEAQYASESTEPVSRPDIIVIMDESFSDFRVFENVLSTNEEVTPFITGLRENTIYGYLCASVFGGGTANSEYEFLSGNTMAFLPRSSIAYQQYFSEKAHSLVSILKEQGYDCIAIHPYYANGWMRKTVYPMMGFDETYFLDDFPQENLIREYVSDQEMFEEIIRLHQQQDKNTPLFLFGVTMQNHGGYAYEGPNYEPTITLEGYSQAYPEAEQYLSLIHETDKAVEYLIEYFSSIDRDVVIVFYGDHMPKVENSFYEELNGDTFDTLDEQMRKQMVPFFIWANYDIEEKEIPCSSINYLSTYVLETAEIPLPPYQQFLKETESLIPAINAYGYYSLEKQGFAALEEASGAEKEAIHAYEILQYNSMFDEENRSVHFFGN